MRGRSLLATVGWALLCLVLGLALLVAGGLGYLYLQDGLTLETKPFDLERFRFLEGGGETTDSVLRFESYENDRAMAGAGRNLINAGDWPFLAFQARGLEGVQRLSFYWTAAGNGAAGGRSHGAFFPGLPCLWDLRSDSRWSGLVMGQGFMVKGAGGAVEIQAPRLVAAGPTAEWTAMLCEWFTLRSWSQQSVNFTITNHLGSRAWFIPLMAGWVLAALLFWFLSGRLRNRRSPWGPLLILGVVWLISDLRWVLNGWAQLQETQRRFAGLEIAERHQAARDGRLWGFIDRLKRHHLPKEPANVFIVADRDQKYLHRKAQYHLYPHRVFNLHEVPKKRYAELGGYLLIMNEPSGLRLDKISGRLLRNRRVFLDTELLEESSWGTFLRLRPPGAGDDG